MLEFLFEYKEIFWNFSLTMDSSYEVEVLLIFNNNNLYQVLTWSLHTFQVHSLGYNYTR